MHRRNRLRTRLLGRSLAVIVASVFATGLSAWIWAAPASAHEVTAMEADCTHVTVHFADFPDAGVMVHIAATVEGHATLATDVLVKSDTSSAELDISAATSDLAGATANVDVDVTWTFLGDQHVHQTLQVTCGTATTTTVGGSTTTSTVAGEETSTTMATTTTSAPGTSTTSTTEVGGATTTSVEGTVGGGATSTTSGAAVSGTSGSSGVLGASVEGSGGATTPVSVSTEVLGASATSPTSSGSLPFTGATTAPLVALGVTVLAIGAAAASAARRKLRSS